MEHQRVNVMLDIDDIKPGTHLLLPAQSGEHDQDNVATSRAPRMKMWVGRKGSPTSREVDLYQGDVLVVETAPRDVDGEIMCRVRRGLSQSIGEVLLSELKVEAETQCPNPKT